MSLDPTAIPMVLEVIGQERLATVFQPIVSLHDGTILGHEALVRGPEHGALELPDALFAAAELEGQRLLLETAALKSNLRGGVLYPRAGKYFINLSGDALIELVEHRGIHEMLSWSTRRGFAVTRLIIEITEHQRVHDFSAFLKAASLVRTLGIGFALDDFGDGRSSLRLWAELNPEFVKIDKFFTRDITEHPSKIQTLKTIVHMAETLGGSLIAEGIETETELAVVRDLGIPFGQGYFIGRPAPKPMTSIMPLAQEVIARREVAVIPNRMIARNQLLTAEKLLIRAAPVSPGDTIDAVVQYFQQHVNLQAVAVVDGQRPIGLFSRRALMEQYTRPFHKERYGKRPCVSLMDPHPMLLERNASIEEMVALLTSDDQRYLTDGFIITDDGKYLGLGTGEQLVRTVTEFRVEAARHANPLTFLPGNVPITQHIDKLVASNNSFVCCYCDLNNFKPFNDQYGYWRGDEMIRLLAAVIVDNVARQKDFVGHVGGDDLIVLFQSVDWEVRAAKIISEFNERARSLFDEEALARGGIDAEDRNGHAAFFPLTTLSIGAVVVHPGSFRKAEDVASAAASAKRRAKKTQRGLWKMDLDEEFDFRNTVS